MIDSIYFDAIAKVEKNFKVNSSILNLESMKKWRISSGSVMLDLLLGGGYVPGWVRNWGGEGSSKSTSSQLTAVAQLLREYRPPINMLWDYENSANPEIMESILKSLLGPKTEMNYDKLFGVRDPETGDWLIPPVIHYYNTNIGETFYNVTANILKMLPDKEFVADENHPEGGRWYKIFENTKEGKAYAGDKFDKKLYQKTKRYYVEDETGGTPQLIAIVDSLQAMVPEDNDGDEVSNAKGIEARMHGENLKRVRGRLRAKHSLVIVIGQLREKPMVMFGTPEYTPGGNTLNHADDVRNKFTKRASPNGGDNVDRRTGFENEVSVIKAGAMDSYQYINVKNEKNKFGLPRRECWLRVWVDHTGKSRGYCPAYDCYQYLIATGRILESNDNKLGKVYKKFTVNWPEKGFDEVKMTWLDFKTLCLARGDSLKEVCLNLGFKKNPKIIDSCFKDIREGNGVELFKANTLGTEIDDDEE